MVAMAREEMDSVGAFAIGISSFGNEELWVLQSREMRPERSVWHEARWTMTWKEF
jgi:hypothetical protein